MQKETQVMNEIEVVITEEVSVERMELWRDIVQVVLGSHDDNDTRRWSARSA
jgi:hypothetical protein